MSRIILLRRTGHCFFNRPKSSFMCRTQEVLLQGQAHRQAIRDENFVFSVLSLQKLITLMAEISFSSLFSFLCWGTLLYIPILPADFKSM